jgi:hypothetical protein
MNYKLAENISWREIDGQILILDPRINKKAHELSPIASYIWLSLSNNIEMNQITNDLITNYKNQQKEEEIQKDIDFFVNELLKLKLISHD